jgi:hypothetical protein
VSQQQTIAKLEALLARVRTRAAAPRTAPASIAKAATAATAAPAAPAPVPVAPAPPPPPPAEVLEPPPPSVDEETTIAIVRSPAPTEAEVVLDVDVQEVTVEAVIGIPAEEVQVAEATESRERLVAAEPVAPEAVQDAPVVAVVEESPPELLAAIEEVEEAPLSSRRPVAPQPEERIADIAFGAEEPSPPRHTPPPESGRLPAAPAAEFESEADITGVREAPPVPAIETPRPRELRPQSIGASLAAGDAVADVVGEAQLFAPATFVELLDASLAL